MNQTKTSIVRVILTHKWAYIGRPAKRLLYARLRRYWSFHPPGYRWAPLYTEWLKRKAIALRQNPKTDLSTIGGWDGTIKLYTRDKVPAGLFRAIKKQTEQDLGIKFKVTYQRPEIVTKTGFSEKDPRYQYQNDCVGKMLQNLRRGGGIVLCATGSGKTKIAGQLFSWVPYYCVFLVDSLDLLYQTQKELKYWLKEPIGVVGDQKFELQRVTVATVQTLKLHMKDLKFRRWFKKVRICLVDELHELMAKKNYELISQMNLIAKFGLTATLQLKRKEVRYKAFSFCGPVIFEFPLSEGIEKKVLTQGTVLQLQFECEAIEYEDWRREYEEQVYSNEVKLKALQLIAQYLIQKNCAVVVLCELIKHIKILDKTLKDLPHKLAYGAIGKVQRKTDRDEFERGKGNLILANKVFKKGINVKRLNVVIDLAEQKSKNDAQQKFGRGVRLHETKTLFRYIDFSSTGTERYRKAGVSRLNVLKALKVPVTKIKVVTPKQALRAVQQYFEDGESNERTRVTD
jgi:superfamily II DNA or RNA helicase